MDFGPKMVRRNLHAAPLVGIKNRYFSAGVLLGGPLVVLAPFLVHFGHLWAPFWGNFGDFEPFFLKKTYFSEPCSATKLFSIDAHQLRCGFYSKASLASTAVRTLLVRFSNALLC